MAQFQIYNYQFGKIVHDNKQKDLFGNLPALMLAEESFPIKQDIFQMIFEEDYNHIPNKEIRFMHLKGTRVYTHKHLIPPRDGIIVMRIANKKIISRTTKDFHKTNEEDYANCLVIIDNRPGIQRMAIEVKKSVFATDTTLCNIISHTLNKLLRPYSLHLDLMHLQDPTDFWTFIDDKEAYPTGFYKIKFHLPYLNLERLQKKYNSLTRQIREHYNGKLDWEITAQNGGALDIRKEDKFQKAQINYFMKDLGGDGIELVPNNNKRKSIKVGKRSYSYMWITDTTFKSLEEDAEGSKLFESVALDEIKKKMKEGID